MSRDALVLYVSRSGDANLRLFDEKGMLTGERTAKSVKHVRVEAGKCSVDISFAEFEAAIVVLVSGSVVYEQRNNVLGVRCVGD